MCRRRAKGLWTSVWPRSDSSTSALEPRSHVEAPWPRGATLARQRGGPAGRARAGADVKMRERRGLEIWLTYLRVGSRSRVAARHPHPTYVPTWLKTLRSPLWSKIVKTAIVSDTCRKTGLFHLTRGPTLAKGDAVIIRPHPVVHDVIGAAIEVHRELGPGLLESTYEICLAHEFSLRHVPYERQLRIPICYKGVALDCAYRADFLVAGSVLVELKSVTALNDV